MQPGIGYFGSEADIDQQGPLSSSRRQVQRGTMTLNPDFNLKP